MSPKKIKNSDILSITESKKAPNLVEFWVNRAIAPSQPSIIPVIKTKIENIKRFRKIDIQIKLKNEKQSIDIVAMFGVTLILINPLANNWIKGLNIFLNRYLEGIKNI